MRPIKYILPLFMTLLVLGACDKKVKIHPDPYAGGKAPLGISFSEEDPTPSHGSAGMEVTYRVQGLTQYNQSDIKVFLHREEADISTITDSTLTVIVPDHASTGEAMLYVKGQVFFGPSFKVDGKIKVDPTFESGNGANRFVSDVIEKSNTNLLMVGSFTDYDLKAINQPINRIVMTTINGEYLSTLLDEKGANGSIRSIVELPSGKFLIGGGFSEFNKHKGINSITRLNEKGSLDTMTVTVVNGTEDPDKSVDTVPTFNGGVSGSVVRLFVHDDKSYAVGNFNSYGRYYYKTSTYDDKILDETKINQIVRMEEDGAMDSTYNYDSIADKPFDGGNGNINDAVMLEDGSIVTVGSFTKFSGLTAGGIVKLKESDGSPDENFNAGESGADDEVSTINYNKTKEKFVLTGLFQNYNGEKHNGIVLLNKDGSIDPEFEAKSLSGGKINFAAQLDNGLIIVSGSFKEYDGITRNGFMVLNPDGSLAAGYNNTGDFQGQIMKIYETQSALGRPAVLMVGLITKFDGEEVNNVVRIEMKP